MLFYITSMCLLCVCYHCISLSLWVIFLCYWNCRFSEYTQKEVLRNAKPEFRVASTAVCVERKKKCSKLVEFCSNLFFCLWFSGNSFQFDIFTYTCYSVDSFHLYVLFVLCFLCSLSIPLHTAATANLFTVSFQSFFYFANVCLV